MNGVPFDLFPIFIAAPAEPKWKSCKVCLLDLVWGSDSGSWIRFLFPILVKPASFGPWPYTGRVFMLCRSNVLQVNGAPQSSSLWWSCHEPEHTATFFIPWYFLRRKIFRISRESEVTPVICQTGILDSTSVSYR